MFFGFLGNLYWTDPQQNVIEVSRTNGKHRYVLITNGLDAPHSLTLDPVKGLLFWADAGKFPRISRTGLDGSNRMLLLNISSSIISDIALDFKVSYNFKYPSCEKKYVEVKHPVYLTVLSRNYIIVK